MLFSEYLQYSVFFFPSGTHFQNGILSFLQDDRGALYAVNSSRITVGPEGSLFFSHVTQSDETTDFTYGCFATSSFLREYKLGNIMKLRVHPLGSTAWQTNNDPKMQYVSPKDNLILKGKALQLWCIFSGK